MFSDQQLQVIYTFFPPRYFDENEKMWYKRCECCFIEIVEEEEEEEGLCFNCGRVQISELEVVEKIFIKIYRKYGLSSLKEIERILDPHSKIKNLYEKCLIHVLHNPQKIKELLVEGVNPDMDFGKIVGNDEFTLLGWCVKENEEIAIKLLVNASKSGEIFRRRNRNNHTALGSEIVNLLRIEFSDQYYRYNIKKLIDLGSKIDEESLNSCGISGLHYEDKPHRQNNIKWLIELGIPFDLEKCIVFECKNKGGTRERCSCGSKRLKETRLGKYLKTLV